eukprot:gene5426-3911_t
MRCTYVNAPGREVAEGIVLSKDGVVQRVESNRFPLLSSVRSGMRLLSINGAPVQDAKEEQRRYKSFEGEILVVLSTEAKDEFDISSDDEDEGFKPNTFLPQHNTGDSKSAEDTSSSVMIDAAKRCSPGKCVIIMSEGSNPALPISQAAEKMGASVMYIDTVGRMKTRQKIDDAGELFQKSLEKGLWIYLERATKSITLLQKLAESIAEVEKAGRMSKQARVFLMCEPHPHFPEALIKDSVTLRCRLQGSNLEVNQPDDLLESKRRMNVIQGNDGAQKPEVTKQKRRVKISGEVDIVHLEKNTFLELSASAKPAVDNPSGDGLTRVAKYVFGSSEKFISLCKVQEGRFAVGTNSGYVVLLDSDGLPLIQFRPHKACVWDVAFSTLYDFSTACEDGTSTIFNYSLAGREVTATSVASFQADVFAVTYADPSDPSSPVLSGGLSATICVLHSDRQNSTFISSGTSIQAMCNTRTHRVIVGGGNGTCSLIDPARCVVLDSTNKHSRKVPAVASHGDIAVTGGFDKIVRVWDVHGGSFQFMFEQQIKEVVTAVATNGKYISVCSGSDLMVWDLRKMNTPLATKTNAWRDLTRGLAIDGNTIVTASVDGIARFWEIS